MAVYVSTVQQCKPNARWKWHVVAHLTANNLDELLVFATKLGLKHEWYQTPTGIRLMGHFDLTVPKFKEALKLGAVESNRRVVECITGRKYEK